MLPARAWATLVAIGCLLALAGGALATDGEASLRALTTAGDGEVPAGVPVTMGWVLTTDEGQPAFHQDARFQVTHENDTLLATSPSSGHDYDGVDPYQVAFPGPGNYTVSVQVHDDGEVRELTYGGTVTPAPDETLDVAIDVPEQVTAGQRVDVGVDVRDPDGRPVEDVEVAVRVQRSLDSFEVLKTRLAGEDPTLGYAFERTGSFHVVAVASPLPGGEAAGLGAASTREAIDVQASASTPVVGAPVEQPLVNDVETGEEGGGFDLFATYDPYTSVGPHGRLRLGMLTLDEATHEPAPDVSYEVSILDPEDREIFHAGSLAGADGFEYVTISRPDPGTYTAHIDARTGDWSDQVVAEFTVLPPVGATNAGPLLASPNASGTLEAREATTFPVYVEDAAGVPLQHGEVDLRWLDEEGIPLATGKLHVHENGTFPVTLAGHEGGEHRLELLAQSLQPAPTPYAYGEEVGQPPVFPVDVTPAGSLDELASESEGSQPDEAPGLGLAAAAAALLAAWLLSARRSR